MKDINIFSVLGGTAGGILTYMFGGFDAVLKALIAFVILDYITGLVKAGYTKTVSSEIGFMGLLKKFLIAVVVAVSVIIQHLVDDAVPLREITIMFFICNEGISILENAAEFIPVPQKLKDILLQLRQSNEKESEDSDNDS